MIRKNNLLLVFLISSHFLFSQTLKDQFPADSPIDVIENLGDYIPLDAIFKDESGKEIVLKDLFEKKIPTILTLNYFECPMLCTLVLNGLAESIEKLTLNAGDEYQIITIDINPNETTAFANQKKRNYIAGYNLQNIKNDWHFLTGDQENIQKIADSIGFIYYYDEDRDEKDINRDISPLKAAKDAIIIDSSQLNVESVLDKILELYNIKELEI